MRKYFLLTTFIVSLLFVVTTHTASAQNKFFCRENSSGDCEAIDPGPAAGGCNPGMQTNPAVCASATNCNATANIDCVSAVPPATMCSCISNVCTPDANGTIACSTCNSPSANAQCMTSGGTIEYACTAGICSVCEVEGSSRQCKTAANQSSAECVAICGPGAGSGTTTASTAFQTCDTASGPGIPTAIGCIPFSSTSALTGYLLRWGFGVAGGIALLMILYAGFQIITSAGDPKRLQTGQELLTSAVAGIILIVFSIFLLRIIGVNILGLF